MKVNIVELQKVLSELKDAKLVIATKYVDVNVLYDLEKEGCYLFGENRVQDFLRKYQEYSGNAKWHFIGTLQTNKVKYIIDKVELIHSVNSLKLINEIERQAKKINKVMPILLEINVADEKSKQGFDLNEIDDAIIKVHECHFVRLDGFMMMAPHIEKEETRKYFRKTKELLDYYNQKYPWLTMHELSMGMSNDYDIALQEGATIIRVGSKVLE